MLLVRAVGHNAAIARDVDGREMVVFGKGIGFPKMPYELTDPNRIQRMFYDVDPRMASILSAVPERIIAVSSAVAEMAERELATTLNPHMALTFADHLSFVLQRLEQGVVIPTPLNYDVPHLYPRESEVARRARDLIETQLDVRLPDSEVSAITLHIITAASTAGDMHLTMTVSAVAQDLSEIFEQKLGVTLDRASLEFARFMLHLRYLVDRLSSDRQNDDAPMAMLESTAVTVPDIYDCTIVATSYLESEWGWKCTREETMYLMMHIYRLCR